MSTNLFRDRYVDDIILAPNKKQLFYTFANGNSGILAIKDFALNSFRLMHLGKIEQAVCNKSDEKLLTFSRDDNVLMVWYLGRSAPV